MAERASSGVIDKLNPLKHPNLTSINSIGGNLHAAQTQALGTVAKRLDQVSVADLDKIAFCDNPK